MQNHKATIVYTIEIRGKEEPERPPVQLRCLLKLRMGNLQLGDCMHSMVSFNVQKQKARELCKLPRQKALFLALGSYTSSSHFIHHHLRQPPPVTLLMGQWPSLKKTLLCIHLNHSQVIRNKS